MSGRSILKSILAVGRTDDSNLWLRMAQFLNHKHIDAAHMQANVQSNTRYHARQPARQPLLRIYPMVSIRIRIHLFISMQIQLQIRIQGTKPMRIRPFAVTES
jgi:hypothetical protein